MKIGEQLIIFGRERDTQKRNDFGSKQLVVVQLASYPQQGPTRGLNIPGVDKVKEIDDIENSSKYMIYVATN